MLKIKYADGTSHEYLSAIETEEYYNGSSRRTITVEAVPNAISVDSLNALLSNEANTASIVMTNDELEVKNVYDGYVLKLSCGIQNKLISAETADAPAIYEDRLVVKLGRRTYIEEVLKKLKI